MIPFKYGQVVLGKDFCGRKELLRDIRNFIHSGQNIVVLGERRVGKTSLVLEAVRREKARILYADFLLVKSASDVCARILRGIFQMEDRESWHMKAFKLLAHLRPSLTVDPVTLMPAFHLQAASALKTESIPDILGLVKTAMGGKAAVVVFDEFQGILNLPDSRDVLALMRGAIQFHSKIPYLFAGSIRHRMDGIFTDPHSPFFKSAIPITVGPLPFGEFAPFLIKRFEEGKRKVADETLHSVFDITYGITGDVQQFCETLWEVSSEGEFLDQKMLGKALQLIFSREEKSYEREIAQLTDLQLRCLTVMARNGAKSHQSSSFLKAVEHTNASAVRKSVERLITINMMYETTEGYRFFNPFFKLWLLMKGGK